MTKDSDTQTKEFWIVTALAVCVLIFVLFQFDRFRMAVRMSDLIHTQIPAASQPYLLVSGLFWTAAGLLSLWWLIRRHTLAPISLKALAVLYSTNYWIEQLLLTRSDLRKLNWSFSAGINLVVLLILFLMLSLPFVRNIFGDHNGQEPQNR